MPDPFPPVPGPGIGRPDPTYPDMLVPRADAPPATASPVPRPPSAPQALNRSAVTPISSPPVLFGTPPAAGPPAEFGAAPFSVPPAGPVVSAPPVGYVPQQVWSPSPAGYPGARQPGMAFPGHGYPGAPVKKGWTKGRWTAVVAAAAVVLFIAGGGMVFAISKVAASDRKWRMVLPDATSGYHREPDDTTTGELLGQLRRQGLRNAIAAFYTADHDLLHRMVAYGANGQPWDADPDRRFDAIFSALDHSGQTVGTVEKVSIGPTAGEARCAPVSGGGVRATVCVWLGNGSFIDLTFTGATTGQAVATVPGVLADMVRPA